MNKDKFIVSLKMSGLMFVSLVLTLAIAIPLTLISMFGEGLTIVAGFLKYRIYVKTVEPMMQWRFCLDYNYRMKMREKV